MSTEETQPIKKNRKRIVLGDNDVFAQISQEISTQSNQFRLNTESSEQLRTLSVELIDLDENNARRKNKVTPDEIIAHRTGQIDLNRELKKSRRIFFQRIIELANSISENTLLHPVAVITKGDRYELRAGERRFLAHLLLGKSEIPALVREKEDDIVRDRVLSLIENVQREDLSTGELVLYIKDLVDTYENKQQVSMSADTLESIIHKAKRTCFIYLQIIRGPEYIYQDVVDDKITINTARKLILQDKQDGNTADKKYLRKQEIQLGKFTEHDFNVLRYIFVAVNKTNALNLGTVDEIDWTDSEKVQTAWNKLVESISQEINSGD
jgi:ParB/RepB/Spo0J family partition protein